MKKRSKANWRMISAIVALVLAFALVAGSVYAWWDRKTVSENIDLTVGEAIVVDLFVGEYAEGNLVPSTAIMKPGDIVEIVVPIVVELTKTINPAAPLTIETELKFDNEEIELASPLADLEKIGGGSLFIVDTLVSADGENYIPYVAGSLDITKKVWVKFVIKFAGEPIDESTYDLVSTANLVLSVGFTVGEQPID